MAVFACETSVNTDMCVYIGAMSSSTAGWGDRFTAAVRDCVVDVSTAFQPLTVRPVMKALSSATLELKRIKMVKDHCK